MRIKTATPENRAKAEKLKRDVEAYEAMRKNRTTTKPPLRSDTQVRTAGAVALARDIKTGAYVPGKALVETESMHADGFAGSRVGDNEGDRVLKVRGK